jgi:hypothetical protein
MAYRTIHNSGSFRVEEPSAGGTITPGMLCKYGSGGTVTAHATEGGRAERLVAMEDSLQGRPVSTNYTSGERVRLAAVCPGTVMNCLIESGDTAVIGDELISSGNGKFINRDNAASPSQIQQTIAYATEAWTALGADALKAVRFA